MTYRPFVLVAAGVTPAMGLARAAPLPFLVLPTTDAAALRALDFGTGRMGTVNLYSRYALYESRDG